ncbi:MAG TPA: amidophosphoribosyltransferase [Solirubrobacteraceae bacterium]|nr:amidophosphoribosyltransferase [Solirubrobacteraceae bacterium]
MALPLDHRDGPRDECGVFGIYAPGHEVARLSYFALYALQHRGQESAGIATAPQGGPILAVRDQGLVSQVFKDDHVLRPLVGDLGIGHVRYSTTGASAWENTQPIVRDDRRELALAHNGNLINAVELHSELRGAGVPLHSTSDSEIIAALLATHPADTIEEALADVLPRLQGAFSTVVMTDESVVAFRDPAGLRPLSIGRIVAADGSRETDGYCIASETCAFDLIGAELIRDVEPGEVVTLSERGLESLQVMPDRRHAFCVFEYIYFARPDSRMGGIPLQVARAKMGEILWREAPVDADVVIPIPDSGNAAARGLARAAGLPQDDGFIKNRYVARTFIQPGQELRRHGLRLKFNPLREVVEGKRLIVVDDSIVRGNTMPGIVRMLRDAGAAEVHVRISSPPIKHPCHYGIDMSTREEMIAHNRTVEQICAEIGADSLHYLSLEGVYEAVGGDRGRHCDACFSGDYPLERSESAGGKFSLERQLPLVRA